MQENSNTRGGDSPATPTPPPGIWTLTPIDSHQALALAARIATHTTLLEDEELCKLLISLVAAIAAHCADGKKCHVNYISWYFLIYFFAHTQKGHDALFDYLVHELKVATDYRASEEGGAA